jgi:hypothetical protein
VNGILTEVQHTTSGGKLRTGKLKLLETRRTCERRERTTSRGGRDGGDS